MATQTRRAAVPTSGPTKFLFKLFTGAHAALYRVSGGRLGAALGAVPILVLHTVGARSGKPRANPLAYFRDGDRFVIVGSAGGADQHPGWVHNLRRAPAATIDVGPRRVAVVASEATGAERERLWAIVVAQAPNFDQYRQRTDRELPVIILTPTDGAR